MHYRRKETILNTRTSSNRRSTIKTLRKYIYSTATNIHTDSMVNMVKYKIDEVSLWLLKASS